jgi:molybdopterin-guanine dinucleotide biosynthesis protein A
MTDRVTAVILAGGRSSRFGRDKLAEPIDGRPMLDHVIDRVGEVASDIIVVAAAEAKADVGDVAGVEIVHDDHPFEGPLAGLGVGLRAVDPGVERVIVAGGDMPTLAPRVLGRLIDGLDRRDAAVLADAERPRPLPLAVRRSVATAAIDRLLADGERRLGALLETLDVEVIAQETWREDDPTGETLRDVDTPGDLAR